MGFPKLKKIIFKRGIEQLQDNCLTDCSSLEYLKIPNSVETIGQNSFKNCNTSCECVFEKDSETIQNMDTYPFGVDNYFKIKSDDKIINVGVSDLSNFTFTPNETGFMVSQNNSTETLTSIVVPDIYEDLPVNVLSNFSDMSSVVNIELPNTLETIEASAFMRCKSLNDIKLKPNIKDIRQQSFQGCGSLINFDIPIDSSISNIGGGMFSGCSSLINITLENSKIDTLYNGTFYGCTKLQELKIPDTVTKIYDNCFKNSSILKKITMSRNIKSITKLAFTGTNRDISVYFPGFSTVDEIKTKLKPGNTWWGLPRLSANVIPDNLPVTIPEFDPETDAEIHPDPIPEPEPTDPTPEQLPETDTEPIPETPSENTTVTETVQETNSSKTKSKAK